MEPRSEPLPEAPKPAAASPVMDVVAPPPVENDSPAGEEDPLDKLAAEDKADQQEEAKAHKQQTGKPAKTQQPGSGVGLAIVATVVIVLGLAALATYAYLQTAK